MTHRAVVTTLLLALLASAASADVLVVRDKRGKLKIVGLPSKVGDTDVDETNWQRFADQSEGFLDRHGYDGVEFRDRERKKPEFYPADEVVDLLPTTEPLGMLNGKDQMATGQWTQAFGSFQGVLGDPEARQVFRIEADFRLGQCYLATGRQQNAAAHFAKWQWASEKSIYTPEVYRILAEIHTARKEYDKAREWYGKIAELPEATETMKYLAQLGSVRVNIEERKFDEAEANAKRIAGSTSGTKPLADVHVFALTLQAEAILRSDNKDRLGEAESVLRGAASKIEGVSVTRKAHLFSTLGDVLYAQGKLEEARFPYARVFCMFTEERGFVANALQNAGQCFIDLSARQEDETKRDKMLVQGMKLLAECAGRYRGEAAARAAAVAYRKNKADYQAARKRLGDTEADAAEEGESEGEK